MKDLATKETRIAEGALLEDVPGPVKAIQKLREDLEKAKS